MSYTPIQPSLPPQGAVHVTFRSPSERPSLAQPASNPSMVIDVDNSSAVDTVRALLATDFTADKGSWIFLVSTLLRDMQTGLQNTEDLHRFNHLSPADQHNLDCFSQTMGTIFQYITQYNSAEWVTCASCIAHHRLPVNESTWQSHLLACAQDVKAARSTALNDAIRNAHSLIDAWVAGERTAAHDTAINNLVAENPKFISAHLISDDRVAEWSHRIREAMMVFLNDANTDVAASALPQPICDRLQAECQAKLDQAESDACVDAKRLYNSELARRQSTAYTDAEAAFAVWKSTVCKPEFQAKEEAYRIEKLQLLDAEKHAMIIQADELKEQQRLAVIWQIINPSKPAEARKAGRQKKRADPTKGSRTSSCAPSRTPSPSPSSRATDKTPTKADFAPGKQAPTSDIPMEESVRDRFAMSPVPGTGQTTKDSMWAPTEVPMAQDAALAPQPSKSSIRATAVEQAVAPVRPDPVDTASQPNPTEVANDVARPVPAANPALTTYGQPATPSPVAQPSDMELLLQRLLQSAMAPVQAAVADVASRLTEIEKDRDWCPKRDNKDMDLGMDPFTLAPGTPSADRHGNLWAQHANKFPGYSRLTEALTDGVEDRIRAEDEFASSPVATELLGTPAQPDLPNGVHPFFFELAHGLMQDNFLWPNFAVNPQITETDVAIDCADTWDEFAQKIHARPGVVPPPRDLHPPFFTFCRNCISEQFILSGTTLGLLGGSMWPSLPDVPSCAPVSDHARGRARPSVAQTTVAAGGRAPLPIDAPSSSESASSTSPAHEPGWHVAGKKGKGKLSWAAVAAPKPLDLPVQTPHTLEPVPITRNHALTGFITRPQLADLPKATIVDLFNSRFPSSPCIPARASKDTSITMYLARAQEPARPPQPAAKARRPVSRTEFTLGLKGTRPAHRGAQRDAAGLVRQVQSLVQASGVKDVAQLIGGRWSSQSPDNFILVFNGNPIYESVLKLTHIFQCVFGTDFALTPARGYTRVVMNSVPTLRNTPSDPLPSAQSLRDELDRNDSCQNMIIFGDPYWLTARTAGAQHGSISFAFLDKDGSKLQRLIRNPPFLFGNRTTKVRKYISHPLLLECLHCHRLGHLAQRCSVPSTRLVCPICGQNHKEEDHTAKCPNVAKHVGMACSCPPVCINCIRAKKSAQAKGHRAASLSCPLRSNFRSVSPPARISSGDAGANPHAAQIVDL